MNSLNLSGVLNVFKVVVKPSLCLPQATVPQFSDLPVPLSNAFAEHSRNDFKVNIRAVVLDKDDCFAVPHTNEVYEPYKVRFAALRKEFPGSRLLIVSNTAGTTTSDKEGSGAKLLYTNTGVHVLPHRTKKPGCGPEILAYFRRQPETEDIKPHEIAVIGDRLMTDMLMANMMGSYGIWIKDGIVPWQQKSVFTKLEQRFAMFLKARGVSAPCPQNPFE